MNQTKVNQLMKDDRFEGFLLVKASEKRLNKNNEPYLDITLSDDTGDINAGVELRRCAPGRRHSAQVRGSVTEYNKRLQFKIDRYRAAGSQMRWICLPGRGRPRPADEMLDEILAIVEAMENPCSRR